MNSIRFMNPSTLRFASTLVRRFSAKAATPTRYNVMTIPCLKDSFSRKSDYKLPEGYLLSTTEKKNCLVIDPSNPKYIEDAVSITGSNLKGILVTHHHRFQWRGEIMRRRHVVGLGEVLNNHQDCPVYAGEFPDVFRSFLGLGNRAIPKWKKRFMMAIQSL